MLVVSHDVRPKSCQGGSVRVHLRLVKGNDVSRVFLLQCLHYSCVLEKKYVAVRVVESSAMISAKISLEPAAH